MKTQTYSEFDLMDATLFSDGYAREPDMDDVFASWVKPREAYRLYIWYNRNTDRLDMRVVIPCGPDGLYGQFTLFGLPRLDFLERLHAIERQACQTAGQLYYPMN